jgi:hypothetical protein
VHLALNRRSGGTLSARDFAAGVEQLWGNCPPLVAEFATVPDLPGLVERGELPDLVSGPSAWAGPLAALGKAALGLQGETAEAGEEGEGDSMAAPRPGRRLGRLISLEVVD